jgi:hypothetical protein
MKINLGKNLSKAKWLLFLLLLSAVSLFSCQFLEVSACGGQVIGGVCFPANTGLSEQPAVTIIGNALSWILGIFGILAIIAFVVSGIQYLVSAGNDKVMETAKKHMTYSIIGVAVALSGFVIIQAIDIALRGTSNSF